VPFGYDDRQPQVDGALDGIPGAITIDTGSNLTAQIQAPFARAHDLVTRLHATVVSYALDVGGRYPIYLVRAHSLRLGSAVFADPLVDLLTRVNNTSNTSTIANVGDGVLRRWIIVFDYPHQRIDFRSGGDTSGNVVHDRSGIVLRAKVKSLVAVAVLGGTPAARAGVAEGAQIVAVNGSAVSASDLDRVRTLLRGAPGTPVRLRLSDGSTHAFTLQKYL
jgi:membrane-associated protease RseP (regulator of RpoE activity)